ncbi:MAG: transcriptional regulator [bacterium]|nr:transcriptional regulator [Acidimicrobiia bacterium]MCY4650840.1 transcriptional regulator [bacterium]
MSSEPVVLDEIIHQSVRLRIITLLVSQPDSARIAYRFIQRTLDLTGGNLTIHLRKLRDAGYVTITKEFRDEKPSTWVQATPAGRQAFADYLANLKRVLGGVAFRTGGST